MTLAPYGKGVKYQDHYEAIWDWLIAGPSSRCRPVSAIP